MTITNTPASVQTLGAALIDPTRPETLGEALERVARDYGRPAAELRHTFPSVWCELAAAFYREHPEEIIDALLNDPFLNTDAADSDVLRKIAELPVPATIGHYVQEAMLRFIDKRLEAAYTARLAVLNMRPLDADEIDDGIQRSVDQGFEP